MTKQETLVSLINELRTCRESLNRLAKIPKDKIVFTESFANVVMLNIDLINEVKEAIETLQKE